MEEAAAAELGNYLTLPFKSLLKLFWANLTYKG